MIIRWEVDVNMANKILSMLGAMSGDGITWTVMDQIIRPLREQMAEQQRAAANPPPPEGSNVSKLPQKG